MSSFWVAGPGARSQPIGFYEMAAGGQIIFT
jgi:hypothetical protein